MLAGMLGLAAGVLAGLFGVGGGILFVPTLTLVLGLTQVHAEASSLLAILPTAAAGAWRQRRYGNVRSRAALVLGVSAVAGVEAGVQIAESLPQDVLRRRRDADDELRRARAESATLVAAGREEADELRAQARRMLEDAREEIALLVRRRDGITAELGELSGVIQALAVPNPTDPPPPTQESIQ